MVSERLTDERFSELKRKIESGAASDDEIAEFLGPDLVNELNAQWSDPNVLEDEFNKWYEMVMKPIGIERDAAYNMFTGKTTIESFAESLTVEQQERFDERFEELQGAYQRAVDERR